MTLIVGDVHLSSNLIRNFSPVNSVQEQRILSSRPFTIAFLRIAQLILPAVRSRGSAPAARGPANCLARDGKDRSEMSSHPQCSRDLQVGSSGP